MIRVLIVEDNPVDAAMARDILDSWRPNEFELIHVQNLEEALRRLSREPFDAVLLDLALPDAKGIDTVTQVLGTSPDVPIVVLSGYDDERIGLQVVQQGAQDYLIKGQGDGAILARAIQFSIERKHAEKRLSYLAQHDPLTGLANRILFRDRLLQALARSRRTNQQLGVMLLDLDRFKTVNDTLGHECGDLLLKEAAQRLLTCVREVDTVSRLGGDEFTLLVEGIAGPHDLAVIAQRILFSIAQPFLIHGNTVGVGVSVGITLFPADDQDMDELLKHADAAMYRVKASGGHGFRFYLSETSQSPFLNTPALQ